MSVPGGAYAEMNGTDEKLALFADGVLLPVDWEENESVTALRELVSKCPLENQMSMYGSFEQAGPLGAALPRQDVQTQTDAGDIVLYAGSQLVIFYSSNAWAYTRLGHIPYLSRAELTQLLGQHDVTVTLAMIPETETAAEPADEPER